MDFMDYWQSYENLLNQKIGYFWKPLFQKSK